MSDNYRNTLTTKRPHRPFNNGQPKSKGHDVVLRALQDEKRFIEVTMMSGEKIRGLVVARDKYTISVEVKGEYTHIIFKHAIESFFGEKADKQAEAQVQ